VASTGSTPEEQLLHNKEIVDSLAAAYQTGQYPPALKALDELIKQGDKLSSYAAFRKILADYALQAEESANLVQTQKKWIANLEDFLKTYPKSDEVPDVLFQLASVNEFNAEEADARKYYGRLAAEYAETEPGRKAAGALRRLDLVGKPIDLKGTGLDGGVVDSSKYAGRHLLVVFWTTTAEPVRRELPELVRLPRSTAPRAWRSSASASTTSGTRRPSRRSSRTTTCPGPRSSSPAAWTAGWPTPTASSRCRR
jgi:hypothetical protein